MAALNSWVLGPIEKLPKNRPWLSKTKAHLILKSHIHMPGENAKVIFGYHEVNDDSRDHTVRIDRRVWEDMNSPEDITVTIEPGYRMEE